MDTARIVAALVVFGATAGFSFRIFAEPGPKPAIFTEIVPGVAVGGFDTVAYFTDNKAVRGRPDITTTYKGVTWRFDSEAHRSAFTSDPGRYEPQFGGYCAYAAASGYTAKGDPEQWTIVGSKLYLNYNAPTKEKWLKDTAGYIAKANVNWPGILQK